MYVRVVRNWAGDLGYQGLDVRRLVSKVLVTGHMLIIRAWMWGDWFPRTVGGVFPSQKQLPNYHTKAYINCKFSSNNSGLLLASPYILS